ncbi:MAG: hypothetical protein ACK5BV_06485 [Bacteroidota bacterium]
MRIYKHLYIFIIVLHFLVGVLSAQETSDHVQEQPIEQLGESESFVAEDDALIRHYQYLLQNPLDINKAQQQDLEELNTLSPIQITSFLTYRKLNQYLISIYELQAIPFWDLITIKKLLPYISLSDHFQRKANWKTSWREGMHQILFGTSIKSGRSSSPTPVNQHDLSGSNERAYIRYKYQFKKSLQYGITAEKDAGETWFKGVQKYGFDFYSAHITMANNGRLKMLILGDYVVNMGQGLLIWQSMAFRKSSEVMLIKRQSPVIRPYHSFGEYLFQRGVAATGVYRYWSLTGFVSLRHFDATIRTDSTGRQKYFSSINSSGLHRTQSEIKNKGSLPMLIGGGSLKYERISGHAAINVIYTDFGDIVQQKDRQPYNLYAWQGSRYANMSIDGAYTIKNIHLFGEYALHHFRDQAFLGGLMMSMDSKVDFSLLYRNMSPGYQTHFGNAFTESTLPMNEKGLYMGLIIRPAYTWAINMYTDIFRFPWLRYAVDAPSGGKEYMVQLSRSIRRKSHFYIRYRHEEKGKNVILDPGEIREGVEVYRKMNMRAQTEFQYNKEWTIRNRMEWITYKEARGMKQTGFLCFLEAFYKPMLQPYAFNVRFQYFEADSYDSRVYAYENDVLYQFSIPTFYGSGYKFFLNGKVNFHKPFTFWVKLSRMWHHNLWIDELKLQLLLEIGKNA